jgi:type 2A phosphatase activator TIP41
MVGQQVCFITCFYAVYAILILGREKTHEGIKEVVRPFDWSYTTDYKGTVVGKPFVPDTEPIPIALLKRPDPILFYEEVVLYESELDDNGISIFSVKVRVMPERMLLLCRLFMRLDNVVFRIRDTRVYVDFKSGKVTREYAASEEKFKTVMGVWFILATSLGTTLTFII